MKNPFAKEDNRGAIAAVLIGGIALGAVAYLYLTDSGKSKRSGFKKKLKEKGKRIRFKRHQQKNRLVKKAG